MAIEPGVRQNTMPTNFTYGVRRKKASTKRGWDQRPPATPVAPAPKEDKVAKSLLASQESARSSQATTAAALQSRNAMYSTIGLLATGSGASPAQLGSILSKVHGKGRVARLARKLQGASSVTELTAKLNRLGFSSPQTHHDEAGTERDVNVYKGQLSPRGEGVTSPQEQRRLMLLARALRKAYGGRGGPLSELIFDPWGSYFGPGTRKRTPYGGHQAHLHFGFSKERW
jgi:hypothetical protein